MRRLAIEAAAFDRGRLPGFVTMEEAGLSALEDERWMRRALELAATAAEQGEVPVGAVVVVNGAEVGAGRNRREEDQDPLAHAEILAIREAAARLGSWRLIGAALYVTLEPCAMCAGAMVNGRVERLVFGARDPKAGFCGSLGDLVRDPRLNHRLEVTEGVLEAECGATLRAFFERLRGKVR
jgi:tRNA(adenine34) deaminase